MRIRMLKSKIHRASVTDKNTDYEGSLGLDEDLMDAAGLIPYEQILVADIDNGTRHETYVVPEERGSGNVKVMGAAAQLVSTGDKLIIMAFADFEQADAANHKPKVVWVDESNQQVSKNKQAVCPG
ncbi:MAG: aspartate 1-decarboxylase [Planctomycetes bacterium]|nr:aspartate 1-decarboxylase [Planctomycetota bacterium]